MSWQHDGVVTFNKFRFLYVVTVSWKHAVIVHSIHHDNHFSWMNSVCTSCLANERCDQVDALSLDFQDLMLSKSLRLLFQGTPGHSLFLNRPPKVAENRHCLRHEQNLSQPDFNEQLCNIYTNELGFTHWAVGKGWTRHYRANISDCFAQPDFLTFTLGVLDSIWRVPEAKPGLAIVMLSAG